MGRTVAPLVQPVAGGIDAQGDPVLHDGELHLVQRPGLREPADAVHAFQPLHNGLFDDLLAVGHGEQLGIEAVALHGEGGVFGQQTLPGQGPGALKQRIKAQRIKAAQLDQHPFADAQVNIGSCQGGVVSRKIYPAVFRGHIVHVQPLQLVGDRSLQPQQTGDTQLVFHDFLPGFSPKSDGLCRKPAKLPHFNFTCKYYYKKLLL